MTRQLTILLTVIIVMTARGLDASAQKFEVGGFRLLPNDVSAFIDPVKDLNGEDCALIKVQGDTAFVFTAPLGIVKRVDNVGEIWLYVPRKSKSITLKHPQWGVLRDYRFPEKIDSHLTYELKINEPLPAVEPVTLVTTVRDTVIINRTDTLMLAAPGKSYPLLLIAGAGMTFGGNTRTAAAGLMMGVMKRHGVLAHVTSDFGSLGATVGSCDRYGAMTDGYTPFYSGRKRHEFIMANLCAAHRLSERVSLFEGVGYGSAALAWELAASEGGGYVKNSHYTCRGVSLEAGAMVNLRRVGIFASVSTIKVKQWYGSIGVCINIGKLK